MPVIGITGGIASGKSTAARLLAEKLHEHGAAEVENFSADDYSHELLESDHAVQEKIRLQFGNICLAAGKVDRAALREIVFADSGQRRKLEAILHPRIRQSWVEKSKDFHSATCYLVVEIPLLFETKSENHFDCIVVVEADTQVQLERLISKRGWKQETARRVIDAQMPAAEKMRRADILILNHHTEEILTRQVTLAARTLLSHHAKRV